MTIDAGLLYLMRNTAGVTAQVSTRSYAVHLPQDVTLPAVVWQRVSTERAHAMTTDPGVVRARFQFVAYASSFDAAKDALDAVRAAISRVRGTYGSTEVLDILIENELDFYDNDADVYSATLDAMIAYRE
jgi:hypothetical protein